MKSLFTASTLLVGSIVGTVGLLTGMQHFYASIFSEIGQALLNVAGNLAAR